MSLRLATADSYFNIIGFYIPLGLTNSLKTVSVLPPQCCCSTITSCCMPALRAPPRYFNVTSQKVCTSFSCLKAGSWRWRITLPWKKKVDTMGRLSHSGHSYSSGQYSFCGKIPLAITAMNAGLPPIKNGEHNYESVSTLDRDITPRLKTSHWLSDALHVKQDDLI